MQRYLLFFIILMLFSSCTSKMDKLYQWENLERELHEIVIGAAERQEPTVVYQKTENTDLPYGLFSGHTLVVSFPAKKRAIKAMIKTLSQLHGEPKVETGITSWSECAAWYKSVSIGKFYDEKKYPYGILLLF